MSEPAICVQGLGKEYRIPDRLERYSTLRDTLAASAAAPYRAARRLLRRNGVTKSAAEQFWALRDISFEVDQGEVVGVIGRNGAGKSTLLKILSRITEPTTGYAEIRGRVGSLLEVGTGFHPELSGRENIYLNGAILGMPRREIERKFDEIVAFAEVDKFIDTPVKHYSSGMYLRLAFGVAAHLEPEILVVDEVLAVGDAAFQKKCLGKMGDVAKAGRTVIFVSHNMGAVSALCSRALLLDNGRIATVGDPQTVISTYLSQVRARGEVPLIERSDREGNESLRFTSIAILDSLGQPSDTVSAGDDIAIELEFDTRGRTLKEVVFQIRFMDSMGQSLFSCLTRTVNSNFDELPPYGRVRCYIPKLPLAPGAYILTIICKENGYTLADKVEAAADVTVASGDYFGTGRVTPPDCGPFLVAHKWAWTPE
jgi:lipopolysaccharide transport system ATP-binding protein